MPDSDLKELTIPGEYFGLRLDKCLALLFKDYSRAQLTAWFKAGRIQIKPSFTKLSEKVRGGEQVLCAPLDYAENLNTSRPEAEAIALDIIFEDTHCLVLNKPAGLVVHPGAGNPNHTLVNALLNHDTRLHALPRAGLIHRLDKDTTGLLIVGKSEAAYTWLVRQMQARAIVREYIALVYGQVISGGSIETGFGRSPLQRLKMAVVPNGKPAITLYTVKKPFTGCTLLNVKLMTGRTHQIRVHMAHIKHPIIGDPLYGGRARLPKGVSTHVRELLANFKRQALHACSLSFAHPSTQEILTFTAPMPDDFHQLLNALDRAN